MQRTIVVSLPELAYLVRDAIATMNEYEATITWGASLEVADHELDTLDDDEVPPVPIERRHVQELAMPYPPATCAISTRLGRVYIDPDLAAHLAGRNARSADLAIVDDTPMLVARADAASEAAAAPITLAALRLLADDEEPPEPELPEAPERRGIRADPLRHWLLALNPDTPVEVIVELLNSGTATVRRRAALHPSLTEETLDGLIRNGPEATRATVVLNTNLSQDTAHMAARDPSPAVRATLATNPRISAELLSQLAHDRDAEVRAEVAANPATPNAVLTVLTADDEVAVRAATAENPRVDRKILRAMSTDSDPRVCAALARNPACPPKVLRELLGMVPHLVLANPNTPRSLLTAGARANDPELHAQVARNPSTPPNILEQLAGDADLDVVHAVAYQSAAPKRARKHARSRLDAANQARADLYTEDAAPTPSDPFSAPDPFAAVQPVYDDRYTPVPEPTDDAYLYTPVAEPTDDDPEPVPVDWQPEAVEAADAPEFVDPFAVSTEGPEVDAVAVVVDWQPEDEAHVGATDIDVPQSWGSTEIADAIGAVAQATEGQHETAGDESPADEPAFMPTPRPDPWRWPDGRTDNLEEGFAEERPPLPNWSSPSAVIPELLDAIDAAVSILRRVIDLGDGAMRRLTKTESAADKDAPDDIAALAARLQAIAEHTNRAPGDHPVPEFDDPAPENPERPGRMSVLASWLGGFNN